MTSTTYLAAALALLLAPLCALAGAKLTDAQEEFFEKKIRPVLVEQCYRCHSADAAKNKRLKGGLQLDTRAGLLQGGDNGAALVPGQPSKSLLIAAIQHSAKVSRMPPDRKLPDTAIADLVKWVEMGAPDPRTGAVVAHHYKVDFEEARKRWAFQLPQKHPAPVVKKGAWPRSDVDRFILARLEEKGLQPVADADRRVLLRRLCFDLTGLPPTPQQLQAFLADQTPQAVDKLVDNLLGTPQFGERWARHWLDVVRYAEDQGVPGPRIWPLAWQYRQYVIDAFNADKPYSEFVAEQLAGELLPTKDADARRQASIAAGVQALGPRIGTVEEHLDERVDTLTQALWGLHMGCVRCHDHKFDPIYRRDYAAFVGIFLNSPIHEDVVQILGGGDPPGAFEKDFRKAIAPFYPLAKSYDAVQKELAKIGARYVPGMEADEVLALVPEKEREVYRKKLDGLAKATTAARNQLTAGFTFPARALTVRENPGPHYRAMTLDRKTATGVEQEYVKFSFIRALVHGNPPPIDWQKESGRLRVALWAASKEHPLTARVFVNRVWQHLFGRGIVASVGNFGATGSAPTHPELLDSLAVEFMEDGWSVKRLIRRLVLTHVYQLSAQHHAGNAALDVGNQFFWRANRRRLESEAIRDSMLAASGRLDLKPPPSLAMAAALPAVVSEAMDFTCRTVYLPVLRSDPLPLYKHFDGPRPGVIVAERNVLNVPTQALFLLNSDVVLRNGAHLADRLLADKTLATDAARLQLAYVLAYGRDPSATEMARDQAFLADWRKGAGEPIDAAARAAWSAWCQSLFASAEFLYID